MTPEEAAARLHHLQQLTREILEDARQMNQELTEEEQAEIGKQVRFLIVAMEGLTKEFGLARDEAVWQGIEFFKEEA